MEPAIRRPIDEASIVGPVMMRLTFASPQQLCHASRASNLPATARTANSHQPRCSGFTLTGHLFCFSAHKARFPTGHRRDLLGQLEQKRELDDQWYRQFSFGIGSEIFSKSKVSLSEGESRLTSNKKQPSSVVTFILKTSSICLGAAGYGLTKYRKGPQRTTKDRKGP